MLAIRTADLAEAETIEALHRRSAMVWERDRALLSTYPDAIASPSALISAGRVRVAVDDGAIVGFSAVVPLAPGVDELDGLFVDPPALGRGIGRLLVADVVARAVGTGCTRLEVTANEGATGFYERLGFTRAGTAPTRFGPAERLVLPLSG
jgi:GNAT superfamily N-acetyltransferase